MPSNRSVFERRAKVGLANKLLGDSPNFCESHPLPYGRGSVARFRAPTVREWVLVRVRDRAWLLVITWHGRINDEAPRVDAAGHAGAVLDALLAQPIHDVQAPHSVVTVEDERSLVGARVQ